MKVLICGGRDYTNEGYLRDELEAFDALTPITCVVHGGQRGVDKFANTWALDNGIEVREYKADWEQFGRSAGPIRNKLMLYKEEPDLVIAFPGNRGTAHMIEISEEQGYPVKRVGEGT